MTRYAAPGVARRRQGGARVARTALRDIQDCDGSLEGPATPFAAAPASVHTTIQHVCRNRFAATGCHVAPNKNLLERTASPERRGPANRVTFSTSSSDPRTDRATAPIQLRAIEHAVRVLRSRVHQRASTP